LIVVLAAVVRFAVVFLAAVGRFVAGARRLSARTAVDRFAVLAAVFFAVVRTVALRAVVRVAFFLASAI
jgi:hypothetical protein